MRATATYSIEGDFCEHLLNWSSKFSHVCFLNSNSSKNTNSFTKHDYGTLAGIDSLSEIDLDSNCLTALQSYYEEKKDWLFGHFSYDLKNELESLFSKNVDFIDFPIISFFQPRYVFEISNNELQVHYFEHINNREHVDLLVKEIKNNRIEKHTFTPTTIINRLCKEEYIKKIKKIKEHLQLGNIYELNFCMEFYAENVDVNPVEVYKKLNEISEAPFSCYYKWNDQHLMCSSPERYLKKTKNKLLSQPIKGTTKRGQFPEEDHALKQALLQNSKEQSENIMIVDLVRNDLSRVAKRGTVKVEELLGLYSFKQVHQLISTVSCEIDKDIHFLEAIKKSFPMGSMTGAPKIRAMQLIDELEDFKRGLFSGSVGYISPIEDFDFNVVIRAILFNQKKKYLSVPVGSAITHYADPEKEYEECLLKTNAMIKVLSCKN